GTDRREIEPIGRTDIAPQHLAEMQRGAERQRRESLLVSLGIEMRHPGPRGGHGPQGRLASAARRTAGDRKDRQDAIADEFQYLAAERMHCASDAIEPGVE